MSPGVPTDGLCQYVTDTLSENMCVPHSLTSVAPATGDVPAQRRARPLITETPAQPQTDSAHACTSTVRFNGKSGSLADKKVMSWAKIVRKERSINCSLFLRNKVELNKETKIGMN